MLWLLIVFASLGKIIKGRICHFGAPKKLSQERNGKNSLNLV